MMQQIRILIQGQFVANLAGGIQLIVFGDLQTILVIDLHPELLLNVTEIMFIMFQLKLFQNYDGRG